MMTAPTRIRLLLAFAALIAVCARARPAGAEPDPTGKGIAGGVLLGGEVVIIGEAIAGFETPSLYWVFGGLGAIAGGIGGYYVEIGGAPRTSYYMLAGGMALSIPALILYLDATNEARRPTAPPELGPDYDEEPLDELDAAILPLKKRATIAELGGAGDWTLNPPSLVLCPTNTHFEAHVFGAKDGVSVLFPIVGGTF